MIPEHITVSTDVLRIMCWQFHTSVNEGSPPDVATIEALMVGVSLMDNPDPIPSMLGVIPAVSRPETVFERIVRALDIPIYHHNEQRMHGQCPACRQQTLVILLGDSAWTCRSCMIAGGIADLVRRVTATPFAPR